MNHVFAVTTGMSLCESAAAFTPRPGSSVADASSAGDDAGHKPGIAGEIFRSWKAIQTNASVTTATVTQYDTMGRVVGVSYNDGITPAKGFGYDTNAFWPSESPTPSNLKGRLVVAGTELGTGPTLTSDLFSYDPMGRVLNMWQCTPSLCGTANQAGRGALTFQYNWTGDLTQWYDGLSGKITYGRSPAGEVTSITQGTYQGYTGNPANLVSSVANGPNGPTSYALGNGLNVLKTYDSLGRQNGVWVCNGPATEACSGGTQLYGSQPIYKGSQMQQQSDTMLNLQAIFGYDAFNRLTSRTVFQGAVQNFSYSYDRYGNRLAQTLTAGSPSPQPSFSVYPTNNQIVGYSYDAAGNFTSDGVYNYTYDAEGNLIKEATVGGTPVGIYVYDALNRRVSAQTSAGLNEYVYDYAGRRTSTWLNPSSGNIGTGTEGRIYWDGQQIAYRAWDGTTYFEQQDYLGTERLRTNYQGTTVAGFTSLPWGDESSQTVGGSGPDLDNYSFAGLEFDINTMHADFRNYSFTLGRWGSPDPYDGSYDLSNPQSFNRYAYVANNPLSFTDPTGQYTNGAYCGDSCGGDGGLTGIFLDIGEALAGLFGFGGPSFHGSLHPRPTTGTPDWGNDPGSFGESLGIDGNLKTGAWGIAPALGLPDAGCEFGACGGGLGFQQTYTPGSNAWTPPTLLQSLGELLLGIDWTDPNGRLFGTHHCGAGGSGSITGQVDAFCYAHDVCYNLHGVSTSDNLGVRALLGLTSGSAQGGCDRVLCSQLRNFTPKNAAERQAGSNIYNVFGCGYQPELY